MRYFDAESGLHYNWQRYYDPSIGRYMTPDPNHLRLVPRHLGETAELEGGYRGVSCQLGQCRSFGEDGGRVGSRASRPEQHHGNRRRLDLLAKGQREVRHHGLPA
ncbi:MAG: hypothetical protein KJ862_18350 [Proteobacteria bacterium]|nr:hypothetical protein [Pseudomonadota bacterium]